jgi:hypothetical protein
LEKFSPLSVYPTEIIYKKRLNLPTWF